MSSLPDTTPGDANGKHGWGIPPPPTYSFDYVKAAQVYWKYRYRLVGDFIQLKGELDELKTAKK